MVFLGYGYATPRGYAPLESTAMVAEGNQCEPFSSVTPTRANSEGKLKGEKCWSNFFFFKTFLIRQFRATLFFSIF